MNTQRRLVKDPLYLRIVGALGKKQFSFHELREALHPDEEKLSNDLDALVRAGIIARRFAHHQVAYELKQQEFQEAIKRLHEVEGRDM